MPYSAPMVCRQCDKPLTNENYGKYAVQRKTRWRICNPCYLAWYRNWERTSPAAARRREHHKNYARANYIGYSNPKKRRYIKVENKRPYSSNCELCGKETKTVYHHWNDEDYSKGLWICLRCHNVAEGVEQGIAQKYLELKQKIEDGVQTK